MTTPSELLKKEAEEIEARTGWFIPPYRMPHLMSKAHKITDILQKDFMMSYEECAIVLRIVQCAVRELKGESE